MGKADAVLGGREYEVGKRRASDRDRLRYRTLAAG